MCPNLLRRDSKTQQMSKFSLLRKGEWAIISNPSSFWTPSVLFFTSELLSSISPQHSPLFLKNQRWVSKPCILNSIDMQMKVNAHQAGPCGLSHVSGHTGGSVLGLKCLPLYQSQRKWSPICTREEQFSRKIILIFHTSLAQHSSLSSKAYLTDSNMRCYSPCVHKQTDKLNSPQPVCLNLPCREWGAFRCLADLTPGVRFVCSDPAEASWREQWAPFYLCLSKMSPASRLWASTVYLVTLKWCIFLFIHQHF